MLRDIRSAIKEWIVEKINNAGNVYNDYIPDHDDGELAVAFRITAINSTRDLQNGSPLTQISVIIYINGKTRNHVDNVCDNLLDIRTVNGQIIHDIFYESFSDIEFEPEVDAYVASILNLRFNVAVA